MKKIEDDRDPFKLIEGICERGGGQAIHVEFVAPTDADLDARWKVTADAGTVIVYSHDRLDGRQNAIRAAVIYCERLQWDPRDLVMGGLKSGGYVFTFKPHPVQPPRAEAARYREIAHAFMTDSGMEAEGDFMLDDDAVVHPIESEIPGAWVEALIWVDARDLE